MRRIIALLQAATVVALAAVLSSCVISTEPLFDPSTGMTSLKPGRYFLQQYVVGNWVPQNSGGMHSVRISLAGTTYSWTDKPDKCDDANSCQPALPDDRNKFTLHDIGGGLLVVMANSPNKPFNYAYDLIEITDEGILLYGIDCKIVVRLPVISSVTLGTPAWQCPIAKVGDLKMILRTYAKRSFPKSRYIWAGQ